MSSSNSIVREKKSAPKIQRSKSFSEEHRPLMTEEREIHKSKSLSNEEYIVDIISPVSIFRLPKALTETKPEAYLPRRVGLGPFHHFRRDLQDTMKEKKFFDVINFTDADEANGVHNIRHVVNRVGLLQHAIKGSYSELIDLDNLVFQRVMSIDAIYLLNYLHNSHVKDTDTVQITDLETEKILSGDFWMLENQIPGDLVLEIWKILRPGKERVLSRIIHDFCEKESPLELTEEPEDVLQFLKNGHLLNVLYNLILQREFKTHRNRSRLIREITISPSETKRKREREIRSAVDYGEVKYTEKPEIEPKVKYTEKPEIEPKFNRKTYASAEEATSPQVDLVGVLADTVSSLNLQGGAIMRKELSILQKMPLGLFINKLKDIDPDLEENISPVEEIQIPSVSLLKKYAGIRFEVCKEKGIKNIKFNKKKKTLYLPPLTLTSNSEVILRNLLAYEAAITKPRSRLEFAEYVDLMCGIIDTPDDVRILREANIIGSDLRSWEIAGIFNGIWRSTGEDEEEEISNIGYAIKEVNEFYGSRFGVRLQRLIRGRNFWGLLAMVSSATALILFTLQAFCEIYDCNKHWFGGNSGLFDPDGSFSSM